MAYQPISLGVGNGTGDGEGLRDGGVKIDQNFEELYASKAPDEYVFVSTKDDLPTPSGGIITLLANSTYHFTAAVDLTGDRLVGGENTAITGSSSENASITSTGLGVGVALLTTVWTTPIRNISFKDVDTVIALDGLGNDVSLDWFAVNFVNIPNIGTIKNFDNWIYGTGAFINSKGLVFDGDSGTIGIINSLLQGDGLAGNIIEVLSTATVSRRIRIIYSSVVAFASTIGIKIDPLATIEDASYILDTISFTGGGTYLSGLDVSSDESLFTRCTGITNTFINGQLYMQGNATVTIISTLGVFTKVLGTTIASVDNFKFSHTDNRLTCEAVLSRKYLIQCNLSFESGNNQQCEFGFYDSKLLDVRTPSRTKSTSSGTGKSENISFNCVVNFIKDDYLEIWCRNNTSTSDITVTEMNFVITEIG